MRRASQSAERHSTARRMVAVGAIALVVPAVVIGTVSIMGGDSDPDAVTSASDGGTSTAEELAAPGTVIAIELELNSVPTADLRGVLKVVRGCVLLDGIPKFSRSARRGTQSRSL